MKSKLKGVCVLTWVVLLLVAAHAQSGASITGVVKDASGAVLPGVSVEASSPALIGKVRSAVTDGSGQYRITELSPGTYTATFALDGFSTFKREGLDLTGSFTVSLNVELTVGRVTQTVVVTGGMPAVDLQSPTRQTVIDHPVIDALPTGRSAFNFGVLIPGVTIMAGGGSGRPGGLGSQDVGGAVGPDGLALGIHGGHGEDQRITINGVSASTMILGGWQAGSNTPDPAGVGEVLFDTAGVSAELATGGVRINFIARDGGNRFAGTVFGSFANDSMQGSNFTDRVQALGFTTPGSIVKNYDVNPGVGGPLLKDRLWFYVSGRRQVANTLAPGVFYNKNANDLNAWVYVPDTNKPGVLDRSWADYNGRVTWQAAARHKFGFQYNIGSNCLCPSDVGPGFFGFSAPEAGSDRRFPLERPIQMDWTSPITSKLLLEASAIHRIERWGGMHLQTNGNDVDPRMVSVIDNGPGAFRPGMIYRSQALYFNNLNTTVHWSFKASYVTGAHAFKFGFNDAWGTAYGSGYTHDVPYSYTLFTQVGAGPTPFSITERAAATETVDVNRDLGLFAQDKWTLGRATISLGVRYDHFRNSFPRQSLEPSPLTPDRHLVFDETPFLNWHDVTPKSGLSYDLSGNGKTALKVSLNKYLRGYGSSYSALPEPNPVAAAGGVFATAVRSWDDSFYGPGDPRTGNYVPDCDLTTRTRGANGECGALDNPLFGSNDVQALFEQITYDPHLATGWGKRDYNWEFSAGVQHEMLPRVTLDVSFFRRWYGNFHVADNLALSASDFNRFTYTTPVDPRLPGGGGYLVTGFPVVKPDVGSFGFVTDRNVIKLSDDVGRQIEHWNGVDVTVNARLPHGFMAQGGVSTGRTSTDNCDIVAKQPENAFNTLNFASDFYVTTLPDQFCKRDGVFITQVKGFAAYVIPKVDVQVSGTFQSLPGLPILANANLGSGDPFGTVIGGVPVTGLQAFVPYFQIAEPGKFYGSRLNQLDFRVGKVLKIGRTRATVNLDMYNLLNVDTITGQDSTYTPVPGGQAIWNVPNYILQARFFKISTQFDF